MTLDSLTALAVFAFVATATPGPNNLMLMASGANFGFRRAVPHMLGVGIGFVAMILLVGVGLVGIFEQYPEARTVLKAVSIAYLLYLAWKIATAAAPEEGGEAGRPITFVQAAAFQWVNPKAWTMVLSAVVAYAPSQSLAAVGIVAAMFALVALPCISAWTVMGQELRRVLTDQRRLRAFNVFMALILVASLYPVVFPTV